MLRMYVTICEGLSSLADACALPGLICSYVCQRLHFFCGWRPMSWVNLIYWAVKNKVCLLVQQLFYNLVML